MDTIYHQMDNYQPMNEYVLSMLSAYRELAIDNRKALHFLRMCRFGGGFTCPQCGRALEISPSEFGKKHWCPGCRYRFADFSETFLSGNKLPWSKIILGVHLFVSDLSARKAAEVLQINYKSARRFFGNVALAILVCYKPKDKSFIVKSKGIAEELLCLKEQQFRYEHRNRPDTFRKIIGYLLTYVDSASSLT